MLKISANTLGAIRFRLYQKVENESEHLYTEMQGHYCRQKTNYKTSLI